MSRAPYGVHRAQIRPPEATIAIDCLAVRADSAPAGTPCNQAMHPDGGFAAAGDRPNR